VLICVYEGDDYYNPEGPENVKLAEIPWEFNPPRAQKDGALEVTYEYGDDGILTVQIHDPFGRHKKRFAIQQAGEDQLDGAQLTRLKRINEELVQRTVQLENTPEYKEALATLKKAEQQVIPKVEDAEDRRDLEELCRQVRVAMSTGDKQKMEDVSAALNDRLLNYAYLL
jgi:molecular chaperone DnaK (HSP70)